MKSAPVDPTAATLTVRAPVAAAKALSEPASKAAGLPVVALAGGAALSLVAVAVALIVVFLPSSKPADAAAGAAVRVFHIAVVSSTITAASD